MKWSENLAMFQSDSHHTVIVTIMGMKHTKYWKVLKSNRIGSIKNINRNSEKKTFK